jgi:hypothetical protein
MNFRQANGKQIQLVDTRIESGFSNFRFVAQDYGSHPVMQRIFSLARKQGFRSLLIEEITEGESALLTSENKALSVRRNDFQRSEVHRISFFLSVVGQTPTATDFIGYVIFKRDFFSGQQRPRMHVFESVMPPVRQINQNNFIHCQRNYLVRSSLGEFSVKGNLYAQQNNLTFVCAHVALRSVCACLLAEGDITYEKINALAGVDHSGASDSTNALPSFQAANILFKRFSSHCCRIPSDLSAGSIAWLIRHSRNATLFNNGPIIALGGLAR